MPETQQTQYEDRGWFDSLGNWFSNRAADISGMMGDSRAQAFTQIRDSEHPGRQMLSMIRGGMSPEDQTKLDTITQDTAFVNALDRAMGDSTVIRALSESTGSSPQDRTAFLETLQNPQNRGLMTRVLERIGESSDDTLDGDELKQVIQQANAQDYVSLNRTLEGMGISDARLRMGAMAQSAGMDVSGLANGGVMGAVSNFIDNPEEGLASWLNNPNSIFAELDEGSRAQIASIMQVFVKFFGGMFKDFANDIGGLVEHYAPMNEARGMEILAGHNPDASPTRGDGNDVQVADASRPARSGAFARAASGYEAPQSAPESVIAAATVEHPELRQQTMGGQSFSLR